MTRLSHSASEKYDTCPQMYYLHYKEKIRSTKFGSALIFGGALDEALNVLLETKLDEVPDTVTDDLERLKQGFDYHFSHQMVNKEQLDIRTSHDVEYYASDFIPEILEDAELTSLKTFISNAGYIIDVNKDSFDPENQPDPIDLYNEISGYIKEKLELNSTDLSYYNYASWLSLKRKGHMMLELYKEEIMPQIKRVVSIQRKVELPNGEGDEFIGYIDFEAELEGYEGIITVDNKTSSRPYKLADINDKGQLLGYDEFTLNGKAGYIVLNKKIAFTKELTCQKCGKMTTRPVKKCPEGGTGKNRCNGELDLNKIAYVKYQILVDNIDEEKKELHFDKLCGILEGIENEEFPQIRENNNCFQFGKPCIYFDYCRSNPADPDIRGLIKHEL